MLTNRASARYHWAMPAKKKFRPIPFLVVPLLIAAGILFAFASMLTQPFSPVPGDLDTPEEPKSADPQRMREFVRTLSVDHHPRNAANPGNQEKTMQLIEQHFSTVAGGKVTRQPYQIGSDTFANVSLLLGDSQAPRIVVGAHYDSCFLTPGADDNASGVAGLIELAYLLHQQAPEGVAIELVAYNTEEPPFFGGEDMGSWHHATSMKENKVDLKAVIVLEMIGYFSDEEDSQGLPIAILHAIYPSTGNFIAVIGNFESVPLTVLVEKAMRNGSDELPVHSLNAPQNMLGIDLSDHRNYWKHGFPAVMVTDTAFNRNENYHRPTDTWDTLDYDRMAIVADQVYAALFAIAGAPDSEEK